MANNLLTLLTERPASGLLFSVGPLLLALALLGNGLAADASLPASAAYAAVLAAFAVLATRYHLASLRLAELVSE